MPKLSPSIRVAAGTILVLSLIHTVVWFYLARSVRDSAAATVSESYLFPVACMFALAGLPGVLVAVGLFNAKNWARIAAMTIGALVGFFCAFAMLGIAVLLGGSNLIDSELLLNRADLLSVFAVYLLVFAAAIWWVVLFSRKKVASQFLGERKTAGTSAIKRPSCPPPIALLAWLMIGSSALGTISWPLILGRIPAMLFSHVFSANSSRWIWVVNIIFFLACGIGLLKLQKWSYAGTIALHVFWLISVFISQLDAKYGSYLQTCNDALQIRETYPGLSLPRFPPMVNAVVTALPTLLLIVGLFYYRRSFLQAVANSHQPSA